jgi:hypothetical protein
MEREMLKDAVDKHEKWLVDPKDGQKADLSGADLSGTVFQPGWKIVKA